MKSSGFIEEAMHEHTELLFRIAYYYVKDSYAAEDIVQDVFMKLYCSHYEEKGELRAYLSRITANASKDYLKSWAYRKIKLSEKLFPQGKIIHRDFLVQQEEWNIIDQVILALPIKQREAIVYYYLENLSIKEISELIGRPESTVKSRLKSGRDLLKQNLAKEEWEVLLHD
ncbi:RNA polymerase sigma factor [Solibacillus silvestris]|uniref:RNA polymerase sigma factor n=1 Tax=Solibacillus silvestris TaxID=76853 RepID=UPI003F7D3024